MRSSISYTLRLFALLAAFVAASCVNDNEPDCPPIGQARQYVLNLRVVTSKAATRMTRAAGHDTDPATQPEDYIDIEGQDFLVLVFDGYGRLIQRFEPSSTVIRQGQGATYELSGVLGETSANEIQVAVIANCKSMNASGAYDQFVLGNTFLSEMYSNGTKWNFTLPHPDGGWQPSIEDKQTIPMYGCSDVKSLSPENATQSADDENRYDLNLGEIKMLRAVAKIEIVDCLSEGVEIAPNVTLSAYNTQGRLIPDATKNPDWNVEGTQVTSPTLPDNVQTAADLNFFTESKTIGGTERKVYSAYVTEAVLTTNRPHINLTVKDSDGQGTSSKEYEMAVDSYPNGQATQGLAALLRNHIYRYEIKSASSNSLTVNYTICPMGSGTADIPAFE